MKTIAAGQFKARCLRLLEEVRAKRRRFVITKRGRPIAQVIPLDEELSDTKDAKAFFQGTLLFEKDIVSPLDEPWEVLK